MRLSVPWALGVFAVAVACRTEEPADDGGTEDGSTEQDLAEPLLAATVDLEVEVTRVEDLEVGAKFVYPGLTQLLIDGRTVGTMSNLGEVGQFEVENDEGGGTLRLRLDGGMVPGEHVLQLFTPGAVEALYSNELTVTLIDAAPPTLEATLGPATVAAGDQLLTHGELLLLISLTTSEEPELVIVRRRDGHWDDQQLLTLPLPGFVSAGAAVEPAVSATFLEAAADGGGTDLLRVAWRVDDPGTRIDFVDVDWAQEETMSDVAPALTLEGDLVENVEWAALGCPMLLGDNVVAELHAPHDTESHTPGDHLVAAVRLVGTPPTPENPQTLHLADTTVDVDALGPALELAILDLARPRSFSIRLDGLRPGVVDFDVLASLRTPSVAGTIPSFADASAPLTTVIGAFGSHVVATLAGGRLKLVEMDTSGTWGALDVSPDADALPAEPPTAALAAGVVAGAPIFLIPYGSAAAVHAVSCSGSDTSVQMLDGLECDAVVVAHTLDGNREDAVDIACLSETALLLGELRALP
jgi:hypothetical protein